MRVTIGVIFIGLLQLVQLARAQQDECSPSGWNDNSDVVFGESPSDLDVKNPTGRCFTCIPEEDSDFIEMEFQLDPDGSGTPQRNITIESCPDCSPPSLTFEDTGTGPLSAGDAAWLEGFKCKLNNGAEERGEENCNTFCAFQAARAIEIFLEWPEANLNATGYNYEMDADDEKAHLQDQSPQDFINCDGGPTVELAIPNNTHPGTYKSICPQSGMCMEDRDPNMEPNIFGRLDMDSVSCVKGLMKLDEGPCTKYPITPPLAGDHFVRGDCFGRCGYGCGDGTASQFTIDCADHDFCTRLTNGTCADEFFHTLDDRMWAPNCLNFEEAACTPVCDAAPPPREPFSPLNALIVAVSGNTCWDACQAFAGKVKVAGSVVDVDAGELRCSAESMHYSLLSFSATFIAASAKFLGFTCQTIKPASDGMDIPKWDDVDQIGGGVGLNDAIGDCYPSINPRNLTRDCGGECKDVDPDLHDYCHTTVGGTEKRLCSCYAPGQIVRRALQKLKNL